MEKFYLKGDTVTTFQHNFHWCLSICHTVIQVYLYHTHKTLGPISEKSWDTDFLLLRWTETTSLPVCFSTLKSDENQTGRGRGIWRTFENIPAMVVQLPNNKWGSMGPGIVMKKNGHLRNRKPIFVCIERSSFPHYKHWIIVGKFRLCSYFSLLKIL